MLRELKTSDIFKMSKILKKMNLKVDAAGSKKVIDEHGNETMQEKTQQQVGAELILSVFENLHLAEVEVNRFLADLAGMSAEEFAELPINEAMEIIKEFKSIAGLSSFLRSANQ